MALRNIPGRLDMRRPTLKLFWRGPPVAVACAQTP
jgi:hypothetical protein